MARAPVRQVSGPSAIQAVAAPVNTYVRPADPAPSNLHQLADALSSLDAGLGAFMGDRKEKAEEAARQRGIRDGFIENNAGLMEGTKRGLIPAHENDAYMEGFRLSQGDLQGRKLYDEARLAYQNWTGRQTANPEEFKTFMGDFLRERVAEENGPFVLKSLNGHIERIYSDLYTVFTDDRSKAVKGQALSTVGSLVMDDIDKADDDGEIDQEALWARIEEERNASLGMHTEEELDPIFIDAILVQAEESDNEDLLNLLDRKWTGKDHAISSDPEVRKKVGATRARIESSLAAKATANREEEERQDKLRHNNLLSDELRKMAEDEDYVPDEAVIKDLSRRDPEFRTKVSKFRQDLEDGKTAPESEEAIMSAIAEIDRGAGKERVHQLRDQGVIKKRETLKMLLDRADQNAKAQEDGGILKDPTFKQMEALIRDAGGGERAEGTGLKGPTIAFTKAMVDYRTHLYQWATANPDLAKDAIKRGEAIFAIGQRILKGLPSSEASQAQEFDSYVPMSERSAVQQGPATPEEVPTPGGLQYRSDTHRETVQALAEKHGISEQEALTALERFYAGGDDDQSAAAPSGATSTQPESPADDTEGSALGAIVDNLASDPWRGSGPLTTFFDWLTGNQEEADSPNTEEIRTNVQGILQDPPMLPQEGGSVSEGERTRSGGLADLVPSSARGYTPDLEGLRPAFKTKVSALQEAFGEQLQIVSGYRDPVRNRKAGGARKSQHTHRQAIDIDVRDWDREKRLQFIRVARQMGFGGIGIYPNSIHIDTGKRRAWGPTHHADSIPQWAHEALT